MAHSLDMSSMERRTFAMILAVTVAGCTGIVGSPPRESDPTGPDAWRRGPGDSVARDELPSPSSRVPLLSHAQYDATIRDLIDRPDLAAPSGDMSTRGTQTLFDTAGGDLSVGEIEWSDYESAAVAVAAVVVADPATMHHVAPDLASTGAEGFVASFGRHAFRRALEADEVARYVALFTAAGPLYPEHEPSVAGVRLVVEAMLQSPHFLYRVDLASGSGPSYAVGSVAFASQLSYALWGTMPDDELLDLGISGALSDPEVARAQTERLLDDPRAARAVESFHAQLLSWDAYANLTPDATLFPAWRDDMPDALREEMRAFVGTMLVDEPGTFADLLVSPRAFVNDGLADLYGVDVAIAPGETREVTLPATRAGVLTRAGFLASHAIGTAPSPIRRGHFVFDRILCGVVGAPPPDATPLPPAPEGAPMTMRQRLELHTGPGTCGSSCHAAMNPLGYALEGFDAIGAERTLDNDLPVDTSGSYSSGGAAREFADAVELSSALATDAAAHNCYAQHWVEYLTGRRFTPADAPLIARLGAGSLEAGAVLDLVGTVARSATFTHRSSTELAASGD